MSISQCRVCWSNKTKLCEWNTNLYWIQNSTAINPILYQECGSNKIENNHQQEENENKNLRCYLIVLFRIQVAFGDLERVNSSSLTCIHPRFFWSFVCSSQAPKMNRNPPGVDRLNDATFSLTDHWYVFNPKNAFYHSTKNKCKSNCIFIPSFAFRGGLPLMMIEMNAARITEIGFWSKQVFT